MCRIIPKIDFAFKKLFGSEENKDLLISLINSIVDPKDKIKDVVLKNPYNLADYKNDKMSILDIKAVDEKGVWFNVEMQIGEDFYFDKRSIYYWSRMVTEQLAGGAVYKDLNKTISINIMDFNIIDSSDNFHNKYRILNEETGKSDDLHQMFEMHYIELEKFRKDFDEIASSLDRWITFLSKAEKLDKRKLPENLADDKEIVKAVDAVDRMFNEEEREIYNIRLKAQLDFKSKIDTAHVKGYTKGIQEGIEKGIEEGRKEEQIKIAKNMLKQKLSIGSIAEITNLSVEEIKTLDKE